MNLITQVPFKHIVWKRRTSTSLQGSLGYYDKSAETSSHTTVWRVQDFGNWVEMQVLGFLREITVLV